MKKNDLIIIVSVLVLAVATALFLGINGKNGTSVVISRDNEVLYKVPLNEDDRIDIDTNIIIIENGKAFVKEANCNNQICVNHKPIKKTGEVIACLPNKVLVEIE